MPTDDSRTGTVISSGPARLAALTVGSGLFFALTSPFNAVTYLPFLSRWLYWMGLITLTVATHALVFRIVRDRIPRWGRIVLVSILATPLVFAAILFVQQAIERPVPTQFWWSLVASIWVINVVLAVLAAHLDQRPKQVSVGPDSPHVDLAAGLRKRLPLAVREEAIWALGAQDHYLDVVLPSSNHLIHMRFGDALSMVDDGLQVHRSWWVSRAAVASIVKKGRKVEILLHSGQVIPVSRAGATRLREADWM